MGDSLGKREDLFNSLLASDVAQVYMLNEELTFGEKAFLTFLVSHFGTGPFTRRDVMDKMPDGGIERLTFGRYMTALDEKGYIAKGTERIVACGRNKIRYMYRVINKRGDL